MTAWAAPVADVASDPGAVLGAVIVVLLGVIGLVLRSIVKGDLVPRAQMDQMLADKDRQIAAQGKTLEVAATVNTELSGAVKTLTESVEDFSQATKMQVHLAEALRSNLSGGSGGAHVVSQT